MKLKKLGVHILGGFACACMALAVTFAVPQAAHAATHYFTGNSEVDATWGRAWVTYVNNYGVSQDTLNNIGKYNIVIDLADEGKPVQLNGQLGGYTYSGTDYTGGYHDIGYGNNARRGYYTFTLRWPSAVGGVGWQGGFYIVARGKGTLRMDKTQIPLSEAGNIRNLIKLEGNSNTSVTPTYHYTGVTSNGVAYNSTTAPTEPGTYRVKAQVPTDKLQYVLGYTSNEVEFTIQQPDTNPGGGSNPGGGNPGGGSNPGGGNPGGGSGGSGGGGSGGGTKPSPEETDPYGDGFAFSIQSESN